jgi:type VI secretion system protein ImpM
MGLEQLERWYAALVQAAMQTLEDDASMESLERALAVAPALPTSPAAALPPAEGHGSWHSFIPPVEARLAACLSLLSTGELLERLAGCTLWWPRAEPPQVGSLRWGPGLPPSPEFAALLARA